MIVNRGIAVVVLGLVVLPLEQFSLVRSVRLQADHHGPAKAGHYVHLKRALRQVGRVAGGSSVLK